MTSTDDLLDATEQEAAIDAQRALQHASIPTLLMCVAQISGDDRWLEPPFRPKRDNAFFADETGGLPAEAQEEVRRAAADLLEELEQGIRELPAVPDDARLARMLSICVGETVPDEYTELALEEMGLRDRGRTWRTEDGPDSARAFSVLIVGAGISGISTAIRLDELGIPYEIVERRDD